MMESYSIAELSEHFERPKASIRTKIKQLKQEQQMRIEE